MPILSGIEFRTVTTLIAVTTFSSIDGMTATPFIASPEGLDVEICKRTINTTQKSIHHSCWNFDDKKQKKINVDS